MNEKIKIYTEGTPNPNALKFILDTVILESGSANFPDKKSGSSSPLAQKLFELPCVKEVFFGRDFNSRSPRGVNLIPYIKRAKKNYFS